MHPGAARMTKKRKQKTNGAAAPSREPDRAELDPDDDAMREVYMRGTLVRREAAILAEAGSRHLAAQQQRFPQA